MKDGGDEMAEQPAGQEPRDELSLIFGALADPTRRAILARLAEGEASVNELAEPFQMSLPAVSKHLKVLEKAGLITRGRSAQLRPARISGRSMQEAADYLQHYRRFWESSFDALAAHLKNLESAADNSPDASTDSKN